MILKLDWYIGSLYSGLRAGPFALLTQRRSRSRGDLIAKLGDTR